jgi:hypothetical protein
MKRFYLAPGECGALLLICASVAGVPAAASRKGQENTTREFHKTLTLPSGQTLSLEHKLGEIHIHGESGREARVSATIHAQAPSQEEAGRFAEEIRIEVAQDAQGIKVRTVYPGGGNWSGSGKQRSFSVDYDIVLPSDAKLWVKNDFGNVEIEGVLGWTDVDNSHGQLDLRNGGAAKLTNAFGGVHAEGIEGNLTIVNSNGTVNVSNVKGALDVKDRFATITIANVQGTVAVSGTNGTVVVTDTGASTINESFGTISVRNIHGNLVANSNNGTIEANTINGSAHLSGSFGAISFSNVSGYVKCMTTNGRVSGRQAGDEVYVITTFGEVSLEQINVREAKGKATLNTTFGSINATGLRKGVRATTGNGAIHLTDVAGPAYAKTSFGAVQAQRINDSLTIENANGTVSAESVRGDVTAKTSFGAVTLSDIAGAITVDNQNGAILITAERTSPGCRNISAKTSFSPIRIQLRDGLGYNVNARTSSGRITTDLPVTSSGALGGDTLNGKIGNGGCALTLTNSNANIEIVKLNN